MAFTQDQIAVASRVWVETCRRIWIRKNPEQMCWLPTWPSLSIADRNCVMETIGAALRASDPRFVQQVLDRDAENSI